ncbi:WD40 repeat-containing protein [Thiothrix nivea DSM 5205]|uniref:WD40 repeat-containing protein n=2 Tax=Thiothrix nivea TaxID=1031 RepID=A0A656HJ72_THINJ|nr:WD40 repeat domain-containing protein [Thiothrix nivea]EIJ35440.1 WD40 repeat-containing protein [Thiothrix nivea DSM 5205]
MRPRSDPFKELLSLILPYIYKDPVDQLEKASHLLEVIRSKDINISYLAKIILKTCHKTRLLLIIDQFEELYTLNTIDSSQKTFIDLCLSHLSYNDNNELIDIDSNISILCAMRSDFMGAAIAYNKIGRVLNDFPCEILGQMTVDELQSAIELPAHKCNISFETGLVDRILHDVGSDHGYLPLLEFTLSLLWEGISYNKITHERYNAVGGVKEALTQYANNVYNEFSSDQKQQIEYIFIQLVQPNEDARDTKQVAYKAYFNKKMWDLVTILADKRLVVTGGSGDSEQVEIIHETLIDYWGLLKNWIDKNRHFRYWQNYLRQAIREWEKNNKDIGGLLRGKALLEAEENLLSFKRFLGEKEILYIESSSNLKKKEEKKGKQRFQIAILIGIFASIGFLGALYFYSISENALAKAKKSELISNDQKNKALKTQSLFLADLAKQELEKGAVDIGALLALNALPQNGGIERPYVIEAEHQLRQGVIKHLDKNIIEIEKPVFVISLSHNEKQLAVAAGTNIQLYNTESFKNEGELVSKLSNVVFIAHTKNDFILATYNNGEVKLWDTKKKKVIVQFDGHRDAVYFADFNSTETLLATASKDKTIKIWDIHSGKELKSFAGHDSIVTKVFFSPDDKKLLSASRDKTARMWDVEKGKELFKFGHKSYVFDAKFKPEGDIVATASADGEIKLWDALTGKLITILDRHTDSVYNLEFEPKIKSSYGSHYSDSDLLLSSSADNTARLWYVGATDYRLGHEKFGSQLAVLQKHKSPIMISKFTEDAKYIITASKDGVVCLWRNLGNKSVLREFFKAHEEGVFDVAMFSDHMRLITASSDKYIYIWSLKNKLKEIATPNEELVPDEENMMGYFPLHKKIFFNHSSFISVLNTYSGSFTKLIENIEAPKITRNIENDTNSWIPIKKDDKLFYIDLLSGNKKTISGFKPLSSITFSNAVFNRRKELFAYFNENILSIYDFSNGDPKLTYQHIFDNIKKIDFTTNGDYFVLISTGESYIIDINRNKILTRLSHDKEFDNFRLSEDKKTYASWQNHYEKYFRNINSAPSKKVSIFHIANGKNIALSYESEPLTVKLSPDSLSIAILYVDGAMRYWNAIDGKLLFEYKDKTNILSGVNFNLDGKYLFLSSQDKVIIYNIQLRKTIAEIPVNTAWNSYFTYALDYNKILIISNEELAIWNILLNQSELISMAKKIFPRSLSNEEKKRYFLE